MKRPIPLLLIAVTVLTGFSQQKNPAEIYEEFKKSAIGSYNSFRDECNQNYAEFLKTAWEWYNGEAPLPRPKEDNPVPPRPYEPIDDEPVVVVPQPVKPIEPLPQPKPISPIKENPAPVDVAFPVKFYGITSEIRLPEVAKTKLKDLSPNSLSDAWRRLGADDLNNTIRDCLEARIRYNLCDWAYLQFLQQMASQFCGDDNTATFLAAFLFCQSGYQMRLADDAGRLVILVGSRHSIYEKPYYLLDGITFYPVGQSSNRIKICNAKYEGETPLSLFITEEQSLGADLSEARQIKSKRFADVEATSRVPRELIKFYDSYPTSAIGNNPLTRWAMYADTPLAEKTKQSLYPALRKAIEGNTDLDAVNKLLNWVQTGFVYEYDDKVWGHDRAFFAEETLYYPYADCEDRAILFSRLVRDLLGLDVALVYYPGHLAAAVKFNEDVKGDAMMINGERFTVCDPTYIGAPVGRQMPDLDHANARAIVLKK